MNQKYCCFSGHRKIPPRQLPLIARLLENIIDELIENGYSFFLAGGALGFDTIAAQTVLRYRSIYPKIELVLVLPCLTQTKSWSETDRAIYDMIKEEADKVIYTAEEYNRGCMLKRNRFLVDNSEVCVCYLTSTKGGTAYTVGYAKSKNMTVINIAENKKSKCKSHLLIWFYFVEYFT